jgi:hypothetical protein
MYHYITMGKHHFYFSVRGGSKLTRGSSQVNLTLIETETRVQAYFDTPFLNYAPPISVTVKHQRHFAKRNNPIRLGKGG